MKRYFTHTNFIYLVLLVYPATVLLIKNINGVIYILLTILGLINLFKERAKPITHDEKLLYIGLSALFLTSQFTTFFTDTEYKYIWVFVYLPLTILLYSYIKSISIKSTFFWYGLILGTLISSGIALYEINTHHSRASGATNAIIFGNLALCMGTMSLASIGWFKQQNKWLIILPIITAILGLVTCALSGTRGGLLSIPFILIILLWYSKKHLSGKNIILIATSMIALLSVLYAIPQTNIKKNINRTILSIEKYHQSEINSHLRLTSVGDRFEMWQAAWLIYTENPVIGVGWHNFKQHAQQQVDKGLRNTKTGQFNHAHSQYFSVLASGGTLNFISLILLFSILLYIFIKTANNAKTPEGSQFVLAGLIFTIIYIVTSISSVPLERARPANFFSFYLAFILAFIYRFENGLENSYGGKDIK